MKKLLFVALLALLYPNFGYTQTVGIDFFAASPDRVCYGDSTTLFWSTTNATSIKLLRHSDGYVFDSSDNVTGGYILDTLRKTEDYYLFAYDTLGNSDVQFVTITVDTCATGIRTQQKTVTSVYPNPFTTGCTVTTKTLCTIEFIDVTGKTQLQSKGVGHIYIDRGSLSPGVYFVRTTDEYQNQTLMRVIAQ